MAALTAIGLGLGVASMGYGLSEKLSGNAKAEEGYRVQQQGYQIQQQAAQQQSAISKAQAASSVEYAGYNRDLNILGAQQSADASAQSALINASTLQEQMKQESVRRNAMEVDSRRTQLEIIRNQQRGRALALATGTAQNASKGSGLQGGYGQISGQSGVNLVGAQQALFAGRSIFDSNSNITQNNISMNNLQNTYAQQRADLTTRQSNLTYAYAGVNAGYQTQMADVQTLMSQGQGYVNQGGGLVNMGNSQSQSGMQFLSAGPQIFGMGQQLQTQLPSFQNYMSKYL